MIKKQTILVVDDDELFLEFIQRMLSDDSINIITATSGKQGLEILKKQEVSMVLSEYRMPLMDGLEFLGKVKIIYPEVLTVILTAQADIELVIKAINDVGVYKFILKPLDDTELKIMIKSALESLQVIKERDIRIQKVKSHEAMVKDLEKKYPGITKVERDEDGYILTNE